MAGRGERRVTRSASRKARVTAAVATGPLGALSHDELGVIFDGLADPLEPAVAVAFSSTCLGLRTPLRAALEVLKERHARAVALSRKFEMSCAQLRVARVVATVEHLTADDMATLGMILRTNGLPEMHLLLPGNGGFGDAGMQALCEGLCRGAAPSLDDLRLGANNFGLAGAEAFAAVLRRGALPKIHTLDLGDNPLGNQGLSALAELLRKMPALKMLHLNNCEIDDQGLASLFANLGKDDFKILELLDLDSNELTVKSCRTLVSVINEGGLPALEDLFVFPDDNPASEEHAGQTAVFDALSARAGRE